ncbi:MAG TPA: dienelactone hydrolase family protein [Thermoanaerobaculia bacterium]|nr:dienelactone hydrolase family protein [Thermoanaerobaculia bacterium]
MGQRIEFPSNAHTCQGWLSSPPSGKGAAIVVIQEWWGLVPHIQDLVERFAKEGFLAVAPDLYHGKTTTSPDEAGKMLMELDAERAEREIAGAGEYLLQRPECTSKTYAVVGFCMGGALAQYTGAKETNVSATVSFYGGFKKVNIDWNKLSGPILLLSGEKDKGVPPEQTRELERKLKQLGKNVQAKVYPNADHAFFNDTRAQVYNAAAAEDAWRRTLEFFRAHVK